MRLTLTKARFYRALGLGWSLFFLLAGKSLFLFSDENSSNENRLTQAIQWISEEKYQPARELLEGMLKSPSNESVLGKLYYHLTICYLKQTEWSKAEQSLERLSQITPQLPTLPYLRAYLYFRTGNYEQSLPLILGYVKENPADGSSHKILGLNYFMLGKGDLALSELKRTLELVPTDFEACYYLGRLYFTNNKMPLALETFQKAIELDPSSVKAHNHLGQTYEALAQYPAARMAYLKAIELEQRQNTRSEWPYFNLGVLCLNEGRAQEAIEYLRQALDRKPIWSEGKAKLATALLTLGKDEEALALLNEAIKINPGNVAARYRLAQLLTKLGRRDEARQQYLLYEKSKKP